MARLLIVFDPSDGLVAEGLPKGCKAAMLSIADDIEDIDRYRLAQRLAELLLEQL